MGLWTLQPPGQNRLLWGYSTSMGTLAIQVDEEAVVREAIAMIEPPPGIRLRRINLDYVDSTGDAAVQIIFAVKKSIPLNKKRLIALSRFSRAVAESISQLGLPKWPFIKFTEMR
jgi:hypothetical protein